MRRRRKEEETEENKGKDIWNPKILAFINYFFFGGGGAGNLEFYAVPAQQAWIAQHEIVTHL